MQEKTFFIAILSITEELKELPEAYLLAKFPGLFDGLVTLLHQPPVSGAIDIEQGVIEIACQNPDDALMLEKTWKLAQTSKR